MSPAERPEAFCIECGRLHYADELADDVCLDCALREARRVLVSDTSKWTARLIAMHRIADAAKKEQGK